MSGEVVQLRRPGERWASGPVRCLRCKHEWIAARQVPHEPLECPGCGCMAGVPAGIFAPKPEQAVWTCNCGETLLQLVVDRAGAEELLCVSCGAAKGCAT